MKHDDNDGNTLLNQLSNIAFNDCVYRCFNEGLRLDKDNKNRPLLIIDQFHEYFFKNQVISIRRVFDSGDDVISLRRIFDIIYKNKEQMTREKYLLICSDELNEIKHEKMKESQIEFQNTNYDLISKKQRTHRKGSDKLYFPYLESIKSYLSRRNILHEYTNSYIAHSFNKKRRQLTPEELNKISLMKLQKAYKEISWLSFTISRYIGECILFEVPAVPYNQFEGWVGSLYKKNIEIKLNNYWNKRSDLFESWKKQYWFDDEIYVSPYKKGM